MRRTIFLIAFLLLSFHAWGATFPLTVRPLARGAGFSFDLREVGTKYQLDDYGSWRETVDRATLEWSEDGIEWRPAQDFVRVQEQRIGEGTWSLPAGDRPNALQARRNNQQPTKVRMLFGTGEYDAPPTTSRPNPIYIGLTTVTAALYPTSADRTNNTNPMGGGIVSVPASGVVEWTGVYGVDYGRAWFTDGTTTRTTDFEIQNLPKPDHRMATMLFGLEEGTTYHYRVTLSGPGYSTLDPAEGTFTTLDSTPAIGPNKTVVTVSAGSTYTSIRNAISAAYAAGAHWVELQSATPGVPIVVRSPVCAAGYGGEFTWTGTAGAWKKLSVATGHDITFEGSNSTYDTTGADLWELYEDPAKGITASHGVYRSRAAWGASPMAVRYERAGETVSIALLNVNSGQACDNGVSGALDTAIPVTLSSASATSGSTRLQVRSATKPNLSEGNIVTVDGAINLKEKTPCTAINGKQYTVTSVYYYGPGVANPWRVRMSDGTAFTTTISAIGGTLTPLEDDYNTLRTRAELNGGAWCLYDSKLYVRLHNGTDPDTVRIKIPAYTRFMDLRGARYTVIDGFRAEDFGGMSGGIGLENVEDIVITNCTLNGMGGWITGSRTNAETRKNRVVIKGCTLYERGMGADQDATLPVPDWSWVKQSTQEKIGIHLRGVSVSILDNHIEGVFNGVSSYVGVMERDRDNTTYNTYAEAHEVDNNTFRGIGDDAIEPEQWTVMHSYTRNRFSKCYKGISCAPAVGGPLYILRNLWVAQRDYTFPSAKQAFTKLGVNEPYDTAYKLVAHNSLYSINPDPGDIALTGFANTGPTYNLWLYNNYVHCDNMPLDWFYGGVGYPHAHDGNRYHVIRPDGWTLDGERSFVVTPHIYRQGEYSTPANRYSRPSLAGFNEWRKGGGWAIGLPMPGYDGTVPTTLRSGNTPGNLSYNPAQTVEWLHDPNSTYSDPTQAGYVAMELADPVNFDFAPVTTAGFPVCVDLDSVNDECGPGWVLYDEPSPTAGAVPAGTGLTLATPPAYKGRVDGTVIAVTAMAAPTDFATEQAQMDAMPAPDEGEVPRNIDVDSSETRLLGIPAGGSLQDYLSLCTEASALTYIDAADVPFALAHGDDDYSVPYQQSLNLKAALDAAGVTNTLDTVAGGGHTADMVTAVRGNAVPMFADAAGWTMQPAPNQTTPEYTAYTNLMFPTADGLTLGMDIYVPNHITGRVPAVIWLHGAGTTNQGWNSGSRTTNPPRTSLIRYGLVSVSMSYRFTGAGHLFPAQLEDVRACVRWLKENADTYSIDPEAIGVWGGSAGGYLAVMTGVLNNGPDELRGLEAGVPEGYRLTPAVLHQLESGAVDTTFTGAVTASVKSGPGILRGTKTVSAVAGVATFDLLAVSEPGDYVLTFTPATGTPLDVPIYIGANRPPVLTIPAVRARAGSTVEMYIEATDPDGSMDSIGGVSVNGPGGAVSFFMGSVTSCGTGCKRLYISFPVDVPGNYTVQATASDGEAEHTISSVSRARRPTSAAAVVG